MFLSSVENDFLITENVFEEITDILESAFETQSIINSYMVESSTVILESSFSNTIKSVFQKIVEFIKKVTDKFLVLFMNKADYIKYINDKYSDRITKLTDKELGTIVYEYKEFKFPDNIPVPGLFNSVQKFIKKLSDFSLAPDDENKLETMRYFYSEGLDIARGNILGKNEKIKEYFFKSEVSALFRGSNEVFMKRLNKKDFEQMLNNVLSYKEVKKMVENDKEKILKDFDKYMKLVTDAINVKYNKNMTATVSNTNGKEIVTDIFTANMYKDYQALLASFISKILEMYTIIFTEKLNALKDQYNMQTDILKKVIILVV